MDARGAEEIIEGGGREIKDRSGQKDRFRPKIVKTRAILAIFRPFEDFCDFRFGRFGIAFGSIDMASKGRGGPP